MIVVKRYKLIHNAYDGGRSTSKEGTATLGHDARRVYCEFAPRFCYPVCLIFY